MNILKRSLRIGPAPIPEEPVVIGPQSRDTIVINPKTDRPRVERMIIGPEVRTVVTVEHTPAVIVEAPTRPYWDEKGWSCVTGNGYREYLGVYRVLDRKQRVELTFPGRIVEERGRVHAYISKPPEQCRQHVKWPCFSHQGKGVYRLEWYRAASNPDEAIVYFEQILDESVNGNRRARYR